MTTDVIKFYAPFQRLVEANEHNPHIALRKGIILQAIIDATYTGTSARARKDAIEAKEWLFTDSDYFDLICDQAGYEKSFIRKVARETIKLHHSKKAARKRQILMENDPSDIEFIKPKYAFS